MKKTLWICLLTLAVVMSFFSSHGFHVAIDCCTTTSKPRKTSIGPIMRCFEQKPRYGCPHAFLIITDSGKSFCLDPNLWWLKKEINKGKLECEPDISANRRFEVLDEDDLE